MIDTNMELVANVLVKQNEYEKVEGHIIGEYVYFVCYDFGHARGVKKIAKSWFEKKDLNTLGWATQLLLEAPYMTMSEFEELIAPPLPFDEIEPEA